MRAILLHLIAMMIMFALGVGFDRLFPTREMKTIATIELPRGPTPTFLDRQTHLIFDYDPIKFNPNGTYRVSGPTPPELNGFHGFDVWQKQIDDRISRYVGILNQTRKVDSSQPRYMGMLNESIHYSSQPAAFAVVTERRLFFVTGRSENGHEYSFDGEFVDKEFNVLRGTLVKFENGRKVFDRLLSFYQAQELR